MAKLFVSVSRTIDSPTRNVHFHNAILDHAAPIDTIDILSIEQEMKERVGGNTTLLYYQVLET